MVPAAAVKSPVVPVPPVTADPAPVVVEFVVTLTTGPLALPVWMATVNWSVDAFRLPPNALAKVICGSGVSVKTQVTFGPVSPVPGLGKGNENDAPVPAATTVLSNVFVQL